MKIKLNLLNTMFFISLIGILALLFISENLTPKLTNINNITNENLETKVKVQGEIINIKNYEDSNFQVILIKDDTGEIGVTIGKSFNITNNQKVIVIGIIKEYQKKLQVQADKIVLS